MTYNEPELIEMGSAEELVRIFLDVIQIENIVPPQPGKNPSQVYISEF